MAKRTAKGASDKPRRKKEDTTTAAGGQANWEAHLRHSQPYEGRPSTSATSDAKPRTPDAAIGYAGSKRSDVFHRSSCTSVGKISEHNLVHYARRDEAIKAVQAAVFHL